MTASALWPSRVRIVRGPRDARVLVDVRVLVVSGILAVLIVATGAIALTLGESELSVGDVFAALVGAAEPGTARIVTEWRLPRIVVAILGGAALALSGAIFQSMTRNPLGSPDIIGFSTGAYTGALVVTLVLGASSLFVPAGAFAGGLAAALAVFLLSRRSGTQGFHLIVVGIAISAVLTAVNAYLLATAQLEEAMSVAIWGAGTLNGMRWAQVLPVAAVLVIAALVLAASARRLMVLELGDDHARMLGVGAARTRIVLLVAGVALVSAITAVAGPITFIALAAPQIARRLTRATGPNLLASATLGAFLLLVSDVIAQRVIAPGQLPVGVVTACLGGAYLVWLLTRTRKGEV